MTAQRSRLPIVVAAIALVLHVALSYFAIPSMVTMTEERLLDLTLITRAYCAWITIARGAFALALIAGAVVWRATGTAPGFAAGAVCGVLAGLLLFEAAAAAFTLIVLLQDPPI